MDDLVAAADRLLGVSPPPPAQPQPWTGDSSTDPPDYPRKTPEPAPVVVAPVVAPPAPEAPAPPKKKKKKKKPEESGEESEDSSSDDGKKHKKDKKRRYSEDDRPPPAAAPAPIIVMAPAPQPGYPPPAPYQYPPPPPPQQQYAPPPPGQPMTINVGQGQDQGGSKPQPPPPEDKKKKSGEPMCPHWVFCYFWFISFVIFTIGVLMYAFGAIAFYNSEFLVENLIKDSKGHMKGFNSMGLLKDMATNLMWSGMAVTTMGFFGCCGLICKNLWMLGIYSFLLTALVLSQVIFVIIFAVSKDLILDSVKSKMKTSLTENYDGHLNSTNQVSGLFGIVMVLYECCGVTGPADFGSTVWYQNRTDPNQQVPDTCCALTNRQEVLDGSADPVVEAADCPYTNTSLVQTLPPNLHRGCFSAFWNRLVEMEHTVKTLVVLILVFQATAVCSAFTVRKKIKEEEELLRMKKEAMAKNLEQE